MPMNYVDYWIHGHHLNFIPFDAQRLLPRSASSTNVRHPNECTQRIETSDCVSWVQYFFIRLHCTRWLINRGHCFYKSQNWTTNETIINPSAITICVWSSDAMCNALVHRIALINRARKERWLNGCICVPNGVPSLECIRSCVISLVLLLVFNALWNRLRLASVSLRRTFALVFISRIIPIWLAMIK